MAAQQRVISIGDADTPLVTNTYSMRLRCTNCSWAGVISIPRGLAAAEAKCPTCDCSRLSDRPAPVNARSTTSGDRIRGQSDYRSPFPMSEAELYAEARGIAPPPPAGAQPVLGGERMGRSIMEQYRAFNPERVERTPVVPAPTPRQHVSGDVSVDAQGNLQVADSEGRLHRLPISTNTGVVDNQNRTTLEEEIIRRVEAEVHTAVINGLIPSIDRETVIRQRLRDMEQRTVTEPTQEVDAGILDGLREAASALPSNPFSEHIGRVMREEGIFRRIRPPELTVATDTPVQAVNGVDPPATGSMQITGGTITSAPGRAEITMSLTNSTTSVNTNGDDFATSRLRQDVMDLREQLALANRERVLLRSDLDDARRQLRSIHTMLTSTNASPAAIMHQPDSNALRALQMAPPTTAGIAEIMQHMQDVRAVTMGSPYTYPSVLPNDLLRGLDAAPGAWGNIPTADR